MSDSNGINIAITVVALLLVFLFGRSMGESGNQEAKYASSGFPSNCRALIADNLEGYYSGVYTADAALGSIERNCGRFGLIWDEK